MPERERESASGSGGTEPVHQRGTSSLDTRTSPGGTRRALGRLIATPSFIAGIAVVLVTTLAYGTTHTRLLYSSGLPACRVASCSAASPGGSNGTTLGEPSGPGLGGSRGTSHAPSHKQPTQNEPSSTGSPPGNTPTGGGSGSQPTGPQWPPTPPNGTPPPPKVSVVYRTQRSWHGGFLAMVTITNRGTTSLAGWQLWVRYRQDEIDHLWGARWFPADLQGHFGMVAAPLSQRPVKPGASVRFTFSADGQAGPPSGCLFDGDGCTFHRPRAR